MQKHAKIMMFDIDFQECKVLRICLDMIKPTSLSPLSSFPLWSMVLPYDDVLSPLPFHLISLMANISMLYVAICTSSCACLDDSLRVLTFHCAFRDLVRVPKVVNIGVIEGIGYVNQLNH